MPSGRPPACESSGSRCRHDRAACTRPGSGMRENVTWRGHRQNKAGAASERGETGPLSSFRPLLTILFNTKYGALHRSPRRAKRAPTACKSHASRVVLGVAPNQCALLNFGLDPGQLGIANKTSGKRAAAFCLLLVVPANLWVGQTFRETHVPLSPQGPTQHPFSQPDSVQITP